MYTVVMSGLVLLVATWNFLNWDSVYVMLKNHYNAWGYKKKNCKKIKTYTGNVFRKNLYLKVSVNSRLNVF